MKIVQICDGIPPLALGGAGRIAWETSLGLRKNGHDVTVITAADEGQLPKELEGVHIRTIAPRKKRWAHYRSVFSEQRAQELRKTLEEIQPDIIHAHNIAWQIGYRWMQTVQGCSFAAPIVLTAHDAMTVSYGKVDGDENSLWQKDLFRMRWEYNPLRNMLIRAYLQHASSILCVSDTLRSFLERHSLPPMRTMHNGIDTEFWHEIVSKSDARNSLRLPQEATIFLLAGRINSMKGSVSLLHALPKDAHVLLAGNADVAGWKSLGSRLHYYEKQSPDAMRMLYAACDAAVVPSIYLDPFPTVCLEAMACERPVIATSHGGAKEVVEDGINGWILDPQEAGFSQRLEWCTAHRNELDSFEKAARERITAKFSLEGYLNSLLEIYKQCKVATLHSSHLSRA